MYQILLVEDDKSIREVIADYMDEKGKDTMRLTLAEDGRACEGIFDAKKFSSLSVQYNFILTLHLIIFSNNIPCCSDTLRASNLSCTSFKPCVTNLFFSSFF